MRNWAGNLEFQSTRVEKPKSLEELAAVIRANERVRAYGSRHSFSDVADVPGGVHVSLEQMNRVRSWNTAGDPPAVTIEAGMTYGQLAPILHKAGWALPNLASLPHITVAGAVATATHGSGVNNQSLAAPVSAVELMLADGTVQTIRRGEASFDGVVVNLGALGIMTTLTLDLVPTFDIEQHVYRNVPIAHAGEAYEAIIAGTYSVSIFTSWQTDTFEQVWMKCLKGEQHFDLQTIGGTPASEPVHPIEPIPGVLAAIGCDPDSTTEQLGVPGPWHARLPHFRLEHTPSAGEELQSEFFVAREHAREAWAAVASLKAQIRPLIQISEIRTIAPDTLWMSPFYDRPSMALHFTWRREPEAVAKLAKRLYDALRPFSPRPHWAKVFPVDPAGLEAAYPKLPAFRELVRQFDPDGKFQNPFLKRLGLS
jgi:xylitol oxidase